jgi:HlyD family secretion protein
MKKILIGVALLAIASAVGFIAFRNKDNGPKYKTEKVTRGNITETIIATGTVNPVKSVKVGTQVSGTIRRIYADYNSPVKKGELIAEIDPAPFEAQVEQARANLLESKANVEQAEAQLEDAGRTLARQRELYSKDLVISRSELDAAETKSEVANAQLNLAKAQLARASAALKLAETNLGYTKIMSPVNGVVVERNVDVGQTVAASFQTPTLFTIAEDLTKMQLNTNVDEADIGSVKVGAEAEFTVDAYPNSTFKGVVSQVRIAPIIVQNVVTYNALIDVENPDQMLKPGMTANVSMVVANVGDVLKIPNAALRFFPSDAGSPADYPGAGVWIVRNHKPERIQVETGISDGRYTQLVSGNLKEGDEVILESPAQAQSQRTPPRMF